MEINSLFLRGFCVLAFEELGGSGEGRKNNKKQRKFFFFFLFFSPAVYLKEPARICFQTFISGAALGAAIGTSADFLFSFLFFFWGTLPAFLKFFFKYFFPSLRAAEIKPEELRWNSRFKKKKKLKCKIQNLKYNFF